MKQIKYVWLSFLLGKGLQLFAMYTVKCGPGSVVGIATGYGLDGPGIECRWGARFFTPVQTGPGGTSSLL
jgi:hypothetical protein